MVSTASITATAVLAALFVIGVAEADKPHILMVVIDDLGFDDVGFRSHQINTPTVDSLKENGVVLDQYYVQDVCSPSRSTFMTGRYAMHTSIVDWIPPQSSYGLPLNETTIAQNMHNAGYRTRAIGKWHLGFYKWGMTPTFRGFESFYGFYSGGEDYFTHISSGAYDFRRDKQPNCGPGCSEVAWEADGSYSTSLFSQEAVTVVNAHDPSEPLFMYLAYQAVHAPAEVPQSYIDPYNDKIQDKKRRTFAGMLSCMDEGLSNVTAALKAKGMWDNTLVVFTTDNGGPTTTGDGVGACNYPLKGGKHSIWEGGVRGTAVVSGPMIQKKNVDYPNLMHGVDWLPTLCEAAGVKPNGTLPLDGISHWSNLQIGGGPEVRDTVVIGNSTNTCKKGVNCGFGIRVGDWKYLQGGGGLPDTWSQPVNASVKAFTVATCNTISGVAYPNHDITHMNVSSPDECCSACTAEPKCVIWTYQASEGSCYIKEAIGEGQSANGAVSGTPGSDPPPPALPAAAQYLFNVTDDPSEHNEVSKDNPDVVKQLAGDMANVLESYVEAKNDPECPWKAWPKSADGKAYMEPWC